MSDAVQPTIAEEKKQKSESSALEVIPKVSAPEVAPKFSTFVPPASPCYYTGNGLTILKRRYIRHDEHGQPLESVEQMFLRVATRVAHGDNSDMFEDIAERWVPVYFELMYNGHFLPNTPTLTGAGTKLGQLAACFVLKIEDQIGDGPESIFRTLSNACLIQQSGGGIGFSFSRIRPNGDVVHSSGGKASGPISFMRVYNEAFGAVAQGGIRRGANMGCLRVDHPDIMAFIGCKEKEGELSNFNISVAVTDDFMRAAMRGEKYDLINPRNGQCTGKLYATEVLDAISKHAWKNGEPGVLFIDSMNKHNPLPHLYTIETTNPCGEQALGPYENCCLGSINLSHYVRGSPIVARKWCCGSDRRADGDEGVGPHVDWEGLRLAIERAVRFLDDVVSANTYVPAIPELKAAAMRGRRIGLGFMGLADALIMLGIRYGSPVALCATAQIAAFFHFCAMSASVALAVERGPFPAISGSIYDPNHTMWQPPQTDDYSFACADLKPPQCPVLPNMPKLDWFALYDSIKGNGIRNAAVTTVAPTGTIATVAGLEGYGIEPLFALSYTRRVEQAADGVASTLHYDASPLLRSALENAHINLEEESVQDVLRLGYIPDDSPLPKSIKDIFVVSSQISPGDHLRMQAAVQRYFSNSISKTINMPPSTTPKDVCSIIRSAWELKCRGLTVYVAGSRNVEVLVSGSKK